MAMITCPDCNGQLSDSAPTCPRCGRPNAQDDQQSRKVGILLGLGIFVIPMIFSWFTLRKGHTTTARVVSFVWLAVAMMRVVGNGNHPTPVQDATPTADSRSIQSNLDGTTTAGDIARAYEENTVAADQRFKGKRYMVTGTVEGINTDFMGDPYVTLYGGVNQFREPIFGFQKSASGTLANLAKGSTVILLCTGKGDIAKRPMWDSCSLQ